MQFLVAEVAERRAALGVAFDRRRSASDFEMLERPRAPVGRWAALIGGVSFPAPVRRGDDWRELRQSFTGNVETLAVGRQTG